MIKKSGNYSFVILALVAANRLHGPQETDARYQQCKEAMKSHFQVATPATSPLFREYAGRLQDAYKNDFDVEPGQEPLQALWNHVKERCLHSTKGYKANMNRFHSVISDAYRLLKESSRVLLECSYMSLEMDFLNSRVWGYMMTCQLRQRDYNNMPTSTSSKVLALDDKALRTTGANAIVITMLLLGDPYSRRLLACIVQAGLAVQSWHEHSNRELRDVHRSKLWLMAQVTCEFARHLSDIWRVKQSADALRMCEFVMDSNDAHRALPEEVVMLDDEHANNFGGRITHLLAARAKRCLWYFLPPVSMIAMLLPDEVRSLLKST